MEPITPPNHGLLIGPDGKTRCAWCGADPQYQAYHDDEWGRPTTGDRQLFEKLVLEGFQAGLSWLTILRKRDNFREAFANFDYVTVAEFSDKNVQKLMKNSGIIRHRGKINAAIANAKHACILAEEYGSLAAYFWLFAPPPQHGTPDTPPQPRSTSPESVQLARDLKRRGWRFIGPTTAYAFMQAMGLVNDHLPGCHVHDEVACARRDIGQRYARS